MPRISAEARSAALFNAGGKPPPPPAHLSKRAKEIWREVVRSKPVDYFKPGALSLLGNFCQLAACQEIYMRDLAAEPHNYELQSTVCKVAAQMNSAAVKLKLTPSAVHDRKAGILTEKGEPEAEDGKGDVLYGGNVVRF
jgi:phage terminase small subunit